MILTAKSLSEYRRKVSQAAGEIEFPVVVNIEHGDIRSVKPRKGSRTQQQNKAIHLFCRWLAEALNSAGLDVMATMKHDVSVPWNEGLAKEILWKKVQQAMFDKESTTELSKIEVSDVYEVLNRHLAERFGISVPFPSETDTGGA